VAADNLVFLLSLTVNFPQFSAYNRIREIHMARYFFQAGCRWLTPVILETQEAEIGGWKGEASLSE
jgi:hypothetical protein